MAGKRLLTSRPPSDSRQGLQGATATTRSTDTTATLVAESKIIIYHDFLPTPRRGSHVKSGKTHTQSSRYTP